MDRNLQAETQVRGFYDSAGWAKNDSGVSIDAALWEDLRPAAASYVSACRRRILSVIPKTGDQLLDAASGPLQYPEYLEYSAGFRKRVCVDISESALVQAKAKLGDRGDYVRASILELPFADDTFDCSLSLHTIYHIDKDQQAAAVKQLIRVTKPGQPLVVIYANPDRLASRIKKFVLRRPEHEAASGVIYYFAHPLSWWKQFENQCEVSLHPWRSLTAQDSKRLIPGNFLGRILFSGVRACEAVLPGLATSLGAYPMIVLKKRI